MSAEKTLDLDAGLWLTVAALAKKKNVSRQAAAKRVAALVKEKKITTRKGRGGTKLVNVAQYDRAVGEVGDPAKEASADTRAGNDEPAEKDSAYRTATTRARQYEADIKFLDLEERLGKLLPLADIEDAAVRAAETAVRVIDRLATHADAIAAAVGKDGSTGARAKLKEISREIRQELAEAILAIAGDARPSTIETARAIAEPGA